MISLRKEVNNNPSRARKKNKTEMYNINKSNAYQ